MPAEHVVRVSFLDHSYDVIVRRGLLSDLGAQLRHLNSSKAAIVLTAADIPSNFVKQVHDSLQGEGFSPHEIVLPPGESQKSIEQVVRIFDQVLPMRPERTTPLIALGGGVIGDITGFVAATLLRGVPFVQVPTTLLAMVDASVGGKTGVNHRTGKNLIGAFHQPIAVFIDPQVLQTLPPRELRSGLAECIKHEIIRDADGFAALEQNIARALSLDLSYLADLIAHNVTLKSQVVMNDPFEHGERAHLNFGHTFGHAIESALKFSRTHGECVALGMTAAAHLAKQLGMIDESIRGRIVKLIAAAGLPTRGLEAESGAIIESMSFDKKIQSGKLRFILPDRLGHVVMRDDVPLDAVRAAVDSLAGD